MGNANALKAFSHKGFLMYPEFEFWLSLSQKEKDETDKGNVTQLSSLICPKSVIKKDENLGKNA